MAMLWMDHLCRCELSAVLWGGTPIEPAAVPFPANLIALEGAPSPRDKVVVPCHVYPRYTCRENGGAGWDATVLLLSHVCHVRLLTCSAEL